MMRRWLPPRNPSSGRSEHRHAARRGGGRRAVRVRSQGAPDLADGHSVSDDRAARQHRHDARTRLPRRRRARRALRAWGPRPRAAGGSRAFARSSRSRSARFAAPSRADRPRRFLPSAYRDLEELEGFLEHLAREVYDPGLERCSPRCSATPRCAPAPQGAVLAAAPARRRAREHRAHHAYLGGLLEHTVAVATMALELCTLHPRLDRDLLLSAAIVHDLGKTREFTYGAEIERSAAGRMLGHIELGLRIIAEHAQPGPRGRAAPRARELRAPAPRPRRRSRTALRLGRGARALPAERARRPGQGRARARPRRPRHIKSSSIRVKPGRLAADRER